MSLPSEIAFTPLANAQVVSIDGADAVAFAHAQFSNDVRALATGHWQWNAWLDAQGRVRHFFALMKLDDARLLAWQPLGNAGELCDGLSRFVFRAKVALAAPSDWILGGTHAPTSEPVIAAHEIFDADNRLVFSQPGSSRRLASLQQGRIATPDPESLQSWRREDIDAQLPLIAAGTSAMFVPQALDLERVDAIRFDKGCYPGQEIAARLHFRGGNKRALQSIHVDPHSGTPGTVIYDAAGRVSGHVLYSVPADDKRHLALAVVNRQEPRVAV